MDFNIVFVLTATLLFFLVLTRESVIDFKIEYVPNNIILESYVVASGFLIIYSILNKSFIPLINGAITFGIIFLAAIAIATIAFIKAKRAEKKTKKIKEEKEIIINIADTKKIKKKRKALSENTKIILLCLYCLTLAILVGMFQAYYPPIIVTILFVSILLSAFVSYWITKKISYPVYVVSFGLIICFALSRIYLNGNTKQSIIEVSVAIVFAIILELFLNFCFKRFYENGGINIDEKGFALPLEEQPNDIQEESKVTFAIGGGDLILFGAISLIVGLEGVLSIFLNAAFVFFAMLIGFAIIKRENLKILPLVPAITIGYIMYFTSFNIINLSALISFYLNQ